MKVLEKIKKLNAREAEEKASHKSNLEIIEANRRELKESILSELGLKKHDEVVMRLLPSRDDNCGVATGEIYLRNVFITAVHVSPSGYPDGVADYSDAFLRPSITTKTKAGKMRKGLLHYSGFLSWELYNMDGELLLSHKHEDIIVEGKFTDEEIAKHRIRESYTEYYPTAIVQMIK